MRRSLVVVVSSGMLALLGVVSQGAPAQAYGSSALWQIGLSGNCNNPKICGADQLGGFWGWAEFDKGHVGDAKFAGCGHLQGRQLPGSSGAGGLSIEIDGWYVGPG